MENLITSLSKQYGDLVYHIINSVVIFIVGYFIIKLLSKMIMRYIQKSNHDEIVLRFVHTIIKVLLYIVLILMILSELGVNISSLVALFTAAAAGVALALKETIASFVDGFKILFAKPFSKDDLIEVNGTTGKIQEITLLYTYLLTLDNKRVIIPNSQIANSVLINYSSEEMRRVDLEFEVDYDSDINKVKEVIEDEVQNHPLCIKDVPPFVRLSSYNDSSLSFTLRAWCKTQDFEQFKFDILENMKIRFKKEGIEIPYPIVEIKNKAN